MNFRVASLQLYSSYSNNVNDGNGELKGVLFFYEHPVFKNILITIASNMLHECKSIS